jgi:predicted nucleic acid-binding protein
LKKFALDSHVFFWGIREQSEKNQEDMILRTKEFLKNCHANGDQLIFPSVVLGEILTAIEPNDYSMVHNLISQSFLIPPFDSICAQIFARLWRERKDAGVIKELIANKGAKRQELKADCMIVAICLANSVDAIYSHDEFLKKFANGSIPVLQIPNLRAQQSLNI